MAVYWRRLLGFEDGTESDQSDSDTEPEDNDRSAENIETGDIKEARALCNTDKQKRLGKRLAYILRYGAEAEGLTVLPGGYVSLTELMKTHLMRHDSEENVLKEVDESFSKQGVKRFEKKVENGSIYVRACYRRMERNPNHKGTRVKRLLEITINYIVDHIKHFDLREFPDEFLIHCIIHKLKRSHQLTTAAFDCLLSPTIEELDLSDAVLTGKMLKLLGERCPHLKKLSLKKCGYIVTDHVMEILLKKLTELESLNVSWCSHLSDRTVNTVVKYCPNIVHLSLTGTPNISQQALLHLITASDKLKRLSISQHDNLTPEGKELLTQISNARSITLNIYPADG